MELLRQQLIAYRPWNEQEEADCAELLRRLHACAGLDVERRLTGGLVSGDRLAAEGAELRSVGDIASAMYTNHTIFLLDFQRAAPCWGCCLQPFLEELSVMILHHQGGVCHPFRMKRRF